MSKKIIAFDLDDTLAPSKCAISSEMGDALKQLLDNYQVAIISGGQYKQFQTQVIERLPQDTNFADLHIMPTCSTQYYRYVSENDEAPSWKCVYINPIDDALVKKAMDSLEKHAKELGYWESNTWGDILENRITQITFSALGQEAPVDAKKKWDPSGEKKTNLKNLVTKDVPELEVRSGGSTSIDITEKGVDKAFGMKKLMEVANVSKDEILFIGDRLDENGNDYPVKAFGVDCLDTKSPEQTIEIIKDLVAKAKSLN